MGYDNRQAKSKDILDPTEIGSGKNEAEGKKQKTLQTTGSVRDMSQGRGGMTFGRALRNDSHRTAKT